MYKPEHKQYGLSKDILQESRRKNLLFEQRKNRSKIHDEHRSLALCSREKYERALRLPTYEWLVECPNNLREWILVPCPKGLRSLVIATGGLTRSYIKNGKTYCTFKSELPGGLIQKDGETCLDCIYDKNKDMFYVIDVMRLGPQDFSYAEANFRFFWLHSRFEDNNYNKRSAINNKPFVPLRYYDFANESSIKEVLNTFPLWSNNKPELDGFLLLNKKSNLKCNTDVSLTGWITPFMISDVLGIPVNPNYPKPKEYVNPLQYVQNIVSKKQKIKSNTNNARDAPMEDLMEQN